MPFASSFGFVKPRPPYPHVRSKQLALSNTDRVASFVVTRALSGAPVPRERFPLERPGLFGAMGEEQRRCHPHEQPSSVRLNHPGVLLKTWAGARCEGDLYRVVGVPFLGCRCGTTLCRRGSFRLAPTLVELVGLSSSLRVIGSNRSPGMDFPPSSPLPPLPPLASLPAGRNGLLAALMSSWE